MFMVDGFQMITFLSPLVRNRTRSYYSIDILCSSTQRAEWFLPSSSVRYR